METLWTPRPVKVANIMQKCKTDKNLRTLNLEKKELQLVSSLVC